MFSRSSKKKLMLTRSFSFMASTQVRAPVIALHFAGYPGVAGESPADYLHAIAFANGKVPSVSHQNSSNPYSEILTSHLLEQTN